ncbi:hypothetical protein ABZ797_44530, partial [Streptomyces antimycoticus]
MSRRVSLPGADELFRTTGGMGLQSSAPASGRRQANGEGPRVPPPAADPDAEPREGQEQRPDGEQSGSGEHTGRETAASQDAVGERRPGAGDRPKGRQAQGGSAAAPPTRQPRPPAPAA